MKGTYGIKFRLSKQSKFYRWRPAEAKYDEDKELIFPKKLQICYKDRAATCDLDKLDFYRNDKTSRGQHYEFDSIEYLFDTEKYVESDI